MIRIYGASDDLVEIEGPISDEIGAYDKRVSILVGTVAGGVVVRAQYSPEPGPAIGVGDGGTWQLTIDLIDENIPIPWPVRMTAAGYSPVVEIDCPDSTTWRLLREPEGKRW